MLILSWKKKNSLAFIQIFWVTETLIDSLLLNF